MTNEEKAKQIFDGMQIKPPYHEYQFVGAIEYTIKLTKQQLIDKACDAYCKDCEYIGCDKFECYALEKFIKAMED